MGQATNLGSVRDRHYNGMSVDMNFEFFYLPFVVVFLG